MKYLETINVLITLMHLFKNIIINAFNLNALIYLPSHDINYSMQKDKNIYAT